MKIRHCKRYKVYLNDVCKVKSKAVCDKQLGALYCTDVTCVLQCFSAISLPYPHQQVQYSNLVIRWRDGGGGVANEND